MTTDVLKQSVRADHLSAIVDLKRAGCDTTLGILFIIYLMGIIISSGGRRPSL
jgi:hypothetical protein